MPPTPSLQIGGWYDVFCQGTLDNFRASRAAGASAQLIVGPWHHDLSFAGRVGDLNFGSRAAGLGMAQFDGGDLAGLQREWFRRVLDDRSHGAESPGSGVTYFAMGANTWRTAPSWPPPSTRTQRWYLGPSGRLDRDPPGESPAPTAFTYDPDDPVPTHGGAILLGDSFQPGPIDQGAIESRYDVALFTSAPLSSAVDVTGRVRVLLRCRSSAPSTDWVARLCDVHPDGRSLNICDGITRVQRRADALDLIEIDLWSTSNLFLPGHRLRLQITSSCFPRWDRNLNTGDQTTSRRLPALQTVYHDRVRRSWLELEVLED
jgi:putative CocE/NonD family hydrolase